MVVSDKKDVISHVVQFYKLEARAIHCMAIDRANHKLALSRSDSSVEIWDIQHTPYLQKAIVNSVTSSVEDLKWHKKRLFSCGLQGTIVEYNTDEESIKNSTSVTGGAAWCIDIHSDKNLLACGTEQGYINVFNVEDDGLQYSNLLDKQQGRILCLSWDKSGKHLVTGSLDIVRVWNVKSGHAVHKMTTGRSTNKKETIVWSLCVTSDFLIISGDSRGSLCFWDGNMGMQLDSFTTHAADILTVALSEDESSVYCSGVDSLIVTYAKVIDNSGDGGRRKWAKCQTRRISEHDVRALAIHSNNKLFSGGVDGYLYASSFPPKLLHKYPPLLKGPCIKVLPSNRYILLRYLSHIELWKLGVPSSGYENCDSPIKLSEKETQLLELKAKEGETIISSSISDCGRFIAFSTDSAIKFFKFSLEDTPPLVRLPDPADCGPCRVIVFYQQDQKQYCAVATKSNEINILEVEDSGPDVILTLKPIERQVLSGTITHLLMSHDASYLVAADCDGNICVYDATNWELHCNLPKRSCPVTALAIHKNNYNTAVAYSDQKIVEFNLKKRKYTKFSKVFKTETFNHWHSAIGSLTFDARRNSSLLANDDSSISVLDLTEEKITYTKDLKIAKKGNSDCSTPSIQLFNVIKKYKHIVSLNWLAGDEMVVVSVSPLKFMENLPPSLERKLYGT